MLICVLYCRCVLLPLLPRRRGAARSAQPAQVSDPTVSSLYIVCLSDPSFLLLLRSMLSLDTEGRVIRIDSVAKMISPGMRVGWITAPPDFITKYVLLQSQGSQFPSSVSQSMLLGLLRHWGEEGLHGHLESVSLALALHGAL